MLYHLLVGHAPYADPSRRSAHEILVALRNGAPKPVAELEPGSSRELVAIVEQAMSRDAGDRYQSARELASDLQMFIEGRVVRAYRGGVGLATRKWIARNRILSSALATAVLSLSAGFVGYRVLHKEVRNQRAATELRTGERNTAESRILALDLTDASRNELRRNPMCALLLVRKAAHIEPLPQVIQQMHAAVQGLPDTPTFDGHDDAIVSTAVSPDGKLILTASKDGTARVWHRNGDLRRELEGHAGGIVTASFSPSGERVLTASWDGTARVWDLDGGKFQELKEHTDGLTTASFSDDGRLVLTASWDKTLRVWDLGSGASMEFARPHRRCDGRRVPRRRGPRLERLHRRDRTHLDGERRNPARAPDEWSRRHRGRTFARRRSVRHDDRRWPGIGLGRRATERPTPIRTAPAPRGAAPERSPRRHQ